MFFNVREKIVKYVEKYGKAWVRGYLAYHVLLVGLAHAHAVVTRLSFPPPPREPGDEARGDRKPFDPS